MWVSVRVVYVWVCLWVGGCGCGCMAVYGCVGAHAQSWNKMQKAAETARPIRLVLSLGYFFIIKTSCTVLRVTLMQMPLLVLGVNWNLKGGCVHMQHNQYMQYMQHNQVTRTIPSTTRICTQYVNLCLEDLLLRAVRTHHVSRLRQAGHIMFGHIMFGHIMFGHIMFGHKRTLAFAEREGVGLCWHYVHCRLLGMLGCKVVRA